MTPGIPQRLSGIPRGLSVSFIVNIFATKCSRWTALTPSFRHFPEFLKLVASRRDLLFVGYCGVRWFLRFAFDLRCQIAKEVTNQIFDRGLMLLSDHSDTPVGFVFDFYGEVFQGVAVR